MVLLADGHETADGVLVAEVTRVVDELLKVEKADAEEEADVLTEVEEAAEEDGVDAALEVVETVELEMDEDDEEPELMMPAM